MLTLAASFSSCSCGCDGSYLDRKYKIIYPYIDGYIHPAMYAVTRSSTHPFINDPLIPSFVRSFIPVHSFIPLYIALIHSSFHSFARSLVHSINQSINQSIIHLLICSFLPTFLPTVIDSFIEFLHSFFHSSSHSFFHSFTLSFFHSFILSLTHSLIHLHSFTWPNNYWAGRAATSGLVRRCKAVLVAHGVVSKLFQTCHGCKDTLAAMEKMRKDYALLQAQADGCDCRPKWTMGESTCFQIDLFCKWSSGSNMFVRSFLWLWLINRTFTVRLP